jgi:hypothetical protein
MVTVELTLADVTRGDHRVADVLATSCAGRRRNHHPQVRDSDASLNAVAEGNHDGRPVRTFAAALISAAQTVAIGEHARLRRCDHD